MKPLVSVIIPTKNEEKNIGRCLGSIKKQTVKDVEVIVVDNYSTDKTPQIAKKSGVKVFQVGPERYTQRNFGAQKAKGKILAFIDADMELEKEVIEQSVKIFQENKRLVALIVPEISVGKNYWAKVRALERSFYLGEPTIEAPRVFDKKAFFQTGGYDKKLVSGEDWGLKNKVAKLGKIGRIKAKIIHHEGKLSLISHLQKKYYYAKNIRFYQKKYPQEFKDKAGANRILIILRNWRSLVFSPFKGAGVFILKSLEYFVYLLGKF